MSKNRFSRSCVLFALVTAAASVAFTGYLLKANRPSGGFSFENELDGKGSPSILRQRNTALATALGRLQKAHGKYCNHAVSFMKGCFIYVCQQLL